MVADHHANFHCLRGTEVPTRESGFLSPVALCYYNSITAMSVYGQATRLLLGPFTSAHPAALRLVEEGRCADEVVDGSCVSSGGVQRK